MAKMAVTGMLHKTFLLLMFVIRPLVTNGSFVLTVGMGEEECFAVRAPAGGRESSMLSGNFDVLDDHLSADPVVVNILNERLDTLYTSKEGLQEDTFRLQVPSSSRLSICVQNGVNRRSRDRLDRTIGLEVRMSAATAPAPLQEHTQKLVELALNLQDQLYDLEDHHEYLRAREEAHREVTEQTFSRVVRWTILEALALVVVATGQVVYLRKFFETRRYM